MLCPAGRQQGKEIDADLTRKPVSLLSYFLSHFSSGRTSEGISPGLGCYGDPRVRTRHLDKPAADGVRYRDPGSEFLIDPDSVAVQFRCHSHPRHLQGLAGPACRAEPALGSVKRKGCSNEFGKNNEGPIWHALESRVPGSSGRRWPTALMTAACRYGRGVEREVDAANESEYHDETGVPQVLGRLERTAGLVVAAFMRSGRQRTA